MGCPTPRALTSPEVTEAAKGMAAVQARALDAATAQAMGRAPDITLAVAPLSWGAGGGEGGERPTHPPFSKKKAVRSKARILSRPEPQYTEEARRNQVTGGG